MTLEIATLAEFDKLMQEKITAIVESSHDFHSTEYFERCREVINLMVEYKGRFSASKWLPAYRLAQADYQRKRC